MTRGGSFDYDGEALVVIPQGGKYTEHPLWTYRFSFGLRYFNQAPVDLNSADELTIAENQPVGTVLGEFNATDPEGAAITYHFLDGDNNNSSLP